MVTLLLQKCGNSNRKIRVYSFPGLPPFCGARILPGFSSDRFTNPSFPSGLPVRLCILSFSGYPPTFNGRNY